MEVQHVKLSAQIVKHEQKENQSAACSFIFAGDNIYTEYTMRVSIVSPEVSVTITFNLFQ